MHGDNGLGADAQLGLGVYYLLVVVLNLGFALYWLRRRRDARQATVWGAVAGVFLIHALAYFFGLGWHLPAGFTNWTTRPPPRPPRPPQPRGGDAHQRLPAP